MPHSGPHPGHPTSPVRWEGHAKRSTAYGRIIAGLAFAGVATFAQLYSTQAVLPILAADLHVTAAEAALTISLATVGLAVTVIPWPCRRRPSARPARAPAGASRRPSLNATACV